MKDGSTDWLLRFRWSAARRSVESEMLLDIALEEDCWSADPFLASSPGTSWRDWGCDVGVWVAIQ